MPKIIQIATLPEGKCNHPVVFALFDDGTLMQKVIRTSGEDWHICVIPYATAAPKENP